MSISTVSNLSEYNLETQTLLKYFTKFLSKSLLLKCKTHKKNYVSRLVVSCLYDYHVILQFKELQFIYTQLKGWHIENVLLQMNIETTTAKC